MLVAVTDWAVYSVLLRYRPAEIPPLAVLAATIFFGLVVLTPFWLWEVSTGAVMPASLPAAGAVLYVALFASVLAYRCWNRSVALIGATPTGLSIHPRPVFAPLLAVLFLAKAVSGRA